MTTTAPTSPGSIAEQETTALELEGGEPIVDSLRLLDHKTRKRAVPMRLAPRGQYLAFQDGAETKLVALGDRITHLGRGIAADLRLEDPRISRNHAIIVRHGRYCRLLDNRSSHGTFLNGRRILATNIRDGDVIRLGPVAAQYVEVR
jgi:FHA domain